VNPTPKPSTRERLLDAAGGLFYAEGYDVSIDRIAEQAALAKPTVYAHFASKEALIEAVLDARSADFFVQLEAEISRRADDPFEQLVAAFDLLVADLPDPSYHGCICVNAAATFTHSEHPTHRVLSQLDDRLLAVLTELAANAGAKQPASLARQLLLLFGGIKTRGLVDPSGAAGADARAAARALLDHARS
jgi:AcrR family transcriptional regulator